MSETADSSSTAAPSFRRAHVIIVGNEKGGSGKTTTTMHLIVGLLRLGFSVGSMDLDSRQRSLTRYIENRRQTISKQGVSLPMPHHIVIQKSPYDSGEEAKADERERFAKGLARIYGSCDFVVIDTPGSDTYLSRLSHSFANTIITPINDSFVDLDVLASVDGETLNIVKPSIYSEMVWEQKLQRAKRDSGAIDWIVMRNRLSNIDARNKRFMTQVTDELARRIGFRVAPGFSERVIFREMFLQGLTVLDVLETENNGKLSISHVAARQEVRSLLSVLKIHEIDERIEKLRTGEADEDVKAATKTMAELEADLPRPTPPAPPAPVATLASPSAPVLASTPPASKPVQPEIIPPAPREAVKPVAPTAAAPVKPAAPVAAEAPLSSARAASPESAKTAAAAPSPSPAASQTASSPQPAMTPKVTAPASPPATAPANVSPQASAPSAAAQPIASKPAPEAPKPALTTAPMPLSDVAVASSFMTSDTPLPPLPEPNKANSAAVKSLQAFSSNAAAALKSDAASDKADKLSGEGKPDATKAEAAKPVDASKADSKPADKPSLTVRGSGPVLSRALN